MHSTDQICLRSDKNKGGVFFQILKVLKVTLSYVDLVKDLTLTLSLIFLVGVDVLFSSYFTLFQSTIVWLMIFSVGAPLLLSAIQTTIYFPTSLLDFDTWRSFSEDPARSLTGVRITMFCTYLFVPAIQISNKVDALQKKENLLRKTETLFKGKDKKVGPEICKELELLEEYLDEMRRAHLIFKKMR